MKRNFKKTISMALAITTMMSIPLSNQSNFFTNSISPVYAEETKSQDIKWLEKSYDSFYGLSEGMFIVAKNNKCGFIDKNGKEVVSPKYDGVLMLSDGLAAVKKGNKWGFINKQGKEVIGFNYDDIGNFSEGLAPFKKAKKSGYINKSGKIVMSFDYDYCGEFFDGLAIARKNEKWGFINKQGKKVIDFKYDYVDIFSQGLAAVAKDGKWGYIDKTGKQITKFKYDYAFPFTEDMAQVIVNKDGLKVGYINKNGKEVIPLKYHMYLDAIENNKFSKGLAKVGKFYEITTETTAGGGAKYFYIDKNGKEYMVEKLKEYNRIGTFLEGLAFVEKYYSSENEDTDGYYKYGFIDTTGNLIIPTEYDDVTDFFGGIAIVKKDNKLGILKNPLKK